MIEVAGGGFAYQAGTWVFRGLDVRIAPGDRVAILGPNGRGKTTLLKAMLGLVRLSEGRVSSPSVVGYVPQFTQAAFPYTVLDMVAMGRARHIGAFRSPGRHDMAVCRRCLERLGIADFAEREFDALSGGERQMVLIARAIASECEVLVLDEPTSALDFRNQGRILGIIRDLAADQGLTVVFTTHFPQHALQVAGKVLLMYGAADHDFGPIDTVMTDQTLSRLYGMDVRRIRYDHDGRNHETVAPVFQ